MLWVFVAVLLSGVAAIKNSSDVGRAGTEGSLNEGPQDFFETSSYVLLAPSPPIITSSSRTSEPTSYLLSWKPNQDEHFTSYKIRYIKDQHLKNTTLSKNDVSMLWYYISVSSNLTSRLLNNLEPSSLYQVEMVGITNNATSQLAVSSFRTGSEKQPRLPIFTNSNVGVNNPKQNQNLGNPPESPSTPTVTDLSPTSVSLMWYPRYNGGSPITEYIIEIKKVRAGGWEKLDEFISADSTTFMITGLKRGAAYKFRVTSVNTYGRSRPSSSTDPHYTDFGNQSPKILMSAPEITSVVSTNWSNVQINWSYDEAMSKKLNGYLILYWPSDRRKRKHKKKRLKNALATSYELTSLQSGVLYNVKIQAYNSRGKSPVSNLVVFEMPNNHSSPLVVMQGIRNVDNDEVSDPGHAKNHYGDDSSDNDNKSNNIVVKQQISRRDTAFMIAGGALVFVIIALAASGIIYRRSMTNIKKFLGRKPSNDKITASNGATPNDEYSGLNEGNPPYCECEEVSEHGYEHHHVHSDHILYCDHQECFASAPLWWVRGEERGEFCHIVPANAKRQPPPNPAGGAEATPQTAMVTRTYAGNIAGGYLSHPSQGETTEIIESVETSLIDSVQAPLATEEPPNLTLDQ